MKFFDYCATQYASINHQMQIESADKQFDLKKQAQTKAAHELIESQRKWFKFVAKFLFIADFFICKFTEKWPKMPEVPKAEPHKVEVKPEPSLSIVKGDDGQEIV